MADTITKLCQGIVNLLAFSAIVLFGYLTCIGMKWMPPVQIGNFELYYTKQMKIKEMVENYNQCKKAMDLRIMEDYVGGTKQR